MKTPARPLSWKATLFTLAATLIGCGWGHARELPNILWITCEDIGPQLGCYGDSYAHSPNLDRLAARGLRYRVAWSSAPVCAPARTTIITGVYPTSLGAEHMRSLVRMPAFMKLYPQFLRERGYYCTNNHKEDYNVRKPGKVWDDSSSHAHWKNRKPGQPFFAIFNLTITHESQIRHRPHVLRHDPAHAPIPAYQPDTPEVRYDWAQYYDNITTMDRQAGRLLNQLKQAGLMDDTIIFFYGDHGPGMPRSKRWPYNSGLQVPLIVYVPHKFKDLAPPEYVAGGESDRLVAFIDLAPTLLSLAGIPPPAWMQGHAFMGPYLAPRQRYLFGFRGRMDERYDLVRSVRDQRYIYIRNYMPHLIYGQYVHYMFLMPTTQVWKKLYDQGRLRPPQTYFWETKPPEELYDLQNDPDEVYNLAQAPRDRSLLQRFRRTLRAHILQTRDVGYLSEAQQHRRADGTSMYELGHDPKRYPLEKILGMADIASNLKPDVLPSLRRGLHDADSAVRYWAAVGFLARGSSAVQAGHEALRQALADPDPTVRITAAWALGKYGTSSDLTQVLPVLKTLASPVRNGAYVSILDLNVIDALGDKADPLKPFLRDLPKKDPHAVARANSYVPRLLDHILGRTPSP